MTLRLFVPNDTHTISIIQIFLIAERYAALEIKTRIMETISLHILAEMIQSVKYQLFLGGA